MELGKFAVHQADISFCKCAVFPKIMQVNNLKRTKHIMLSQRGRTDASDFQVCQALPEEARQYLDSLSSLLN